MKKVISSVLLLLCVLGLYGCVRNKKMEEPTASPVETTMQEVIVQPEPSDDDFVLVKTYIPDIFVDLRYATEYNFTNQKIYRNWWTAF